MPELQSRVQQEIDTILFSPEWTALSGLDRLNVLQKYEDALVSAADEQYPGGWDAYMQENPGSVEYLRSIQRESFSNAQEDIEAQRAQVYKDTLTGGDKRTFLENIFVQTGAGLNESGAAIAKTLGFDNLAESWSRNAHLIREHHQMAGDRLAEMYEHYDKDHSFVADLAYSFVTSFFGDIAKPHDKNIIKEISDNSGAGCDDITCYWV